jgi:hypothetical protein
MNSRENKAEIARLCWIPENFVSPANVKQKFAGETKF